MGIGNCLVNDRLMLLLQKEKWSTDFFYTNLQHDINGKNLKGKMCQYNGWAAINHTVLHGLHKITEHVANA